MKRLIFLSLISLGLVFQGLAQVDRTQVPPPGPAPEIKIAAYESFELKNGLKVFVIQNDKLPRIAFNLVLDYEPQLEGDQSGYVSTMGSLLRRGTKNRSKDQLDEEIDFIGATLSTSASGIYAASLSKHKEKLLDLMTDVLFNPTFPEEELEKVKKQSISGIQASENDPDYIAGNVAKALVYGKNHPYGEITMEETVNNISLEKIKAHYKTFFKPNIAYLAIVGDINTKEARKLVRKYFDKWEKGDVPSMKYDVPEAPEASYVALVDRSSSVQSVIDVTYPVALKPGSPDAIPVSLMNQILGGSSTGRLFKNLREDKGYTYGSYSRLSPDPRVSRFRATASVRNEVSDSAVAEILHELKGMLTESVSDEELELVKNFQTGSFARSLENPQTIANFAINTARYQLPKDYYTNYLKTLRAVSKEQITASAKQFVLPNRAHIVVVGKGSEIASGLEQFGEVRYFDKHGNEYKPEAAELPEGLSSADVIENYLEAIGGRAKLEKVSSIEKTWKGNMMGRDLAIKEIKTQDGKALLSMDAGGMEVMKQVSNSKDVAIYQMGQKLPLDEDTKKAMSADFAIFPELNYEKLGVEHELLGIESIEGKKAYQVQLTMPGGQVANHFFEISTGLKIRESVSIDTPQGTMEQNTDLSDYEAFSGIQFPKTRTLPLGPQKLKTSLEEVAFDKSFEDALFAIE